MSRKVFYEAVFLLWFGFSLGVTGYLTWQASHFVGCTQQATDGKWTASVHSNISCEDAKRRAEAFLQDKDYEVR